MWWWHPNQNENRGHGLLKNKCTQEKQERNDAEKLETNEWDTSQKTVHIQIISTDEYISYNSTVCDPLVRASALISNNINIGYANIWNTFTKILVTVSDPLR